MNIDKEQLLAECEWEMDNGAERAERKEWAAHGRPLRLTVRRFSIWWFFIDDLQEDLRVFEMKWFWLAK